MASKVTSLENFLVGVVSLRIWVPGAEQERTSFKHVCERPTLDFKGQRAFCALGMSLGAEQC